MTTRPMLSQRNFEFFLFLSFFLVLKIFFFYFLGSRCKIDADPTPITTPNCTNENVYSADSYCGIMQNPSGPWADCVSVKKKFYFS